MRNARKRLGWRYLPGVLLGSLLACPIHTGLAAAAPLRVQPDRTAGVGTPAPLDLHLAAEAFAPESMHVTIYLPPGYASPDAARQRYPVLYANDGQDMPAVGLQPTLARLYREDAIEPVIVVAIHMPADRAAAYGLSDRKHRRSLVGGSRIGPIGSRAQDYSAWVARSLVPYVDTHYRTRRSAGGRSMLGWSLGALNAFNLGWQYPAVFGRVGALSPSFWLAADRSSATAIQRTRLAQAMVDHSRKRAGLRLWFSMGSAEETADRDSDGINDALDDVRDLIGGYRAADGFHARGLRQLGYTVNVSQSRPAVPAEVTLYVLDGGVHNQASWKRVLPRFLRWAYGRSALPALPRGR